MNKRKLAAAFVTALSLVVLSARADDSSANKGAAPALRANFANPRDAYRLRTWWHWINENVTEYGITKDPEAMKRIGLNGAQITNWQVINS